MANTPQSGTAVQSFCATLLCATHDRQLWFDTRGPTSSVAAKHYSNDLQNWFLEVGKFTKIVLKHLERSEKKAENLTGSCLSARHHTAQAGTW